MPERSRRVVLVTGAAGNLGSAVARSFGATGANLVLVDHVAGRLQKILPELAGSPDHFVAEAVDLSDPRSVDEAVEDAIARFGRIDVLVNAAGGFRGGTAVHETPFETWDFMMNLNVRTVLNCCRAVVPHMLSQGSGKIVNVAARLGLAGGAKSGAYSAAKSAVIRLTESMAAELKGYGINVNCIVPGTIDTPQNRAAMPNADTSHWVPPEALADVIVFLASDSAREIYGAAVPVYGRS